MHPSLSLCMIVKDEEKYIRRCLESAKDIFDEIIIVDTGSKDQTVQIAGTFGAKTVSCQWQDDFSIPRNISLEHATGDWIFILDADEWLGPESKRQIESLIRKKDIPGYRVLIQLHPDWTEMKSVRLFRNLPDLRFRGVFHEMLTFSEEQRYRIRMSDITIHHEPWTEEKERNKLPRNESMLQKHLTEFPRDIYQILDLARIKIKVKKLHESRALLESASDILHEKKFQKDLYEFYLAHYYLYLLNYYRALADSRNQLCVCEKAVSEVPMYPLFVFEAAMLYYEKQNYDQALEHFKKCLAFNEKQAFENNMFSPRSILGSQSLAGIGYCYFRKKKFKPAARYFKDSLALKNDAKIKTMYHSAVMLGNHPH